MCEADKQKICSENCHDALKVIFEKLDRLDIAIRGNGKLGVLTRLTLLEHGFTWRNRLVWMLIGCFVTGVVAVGVNWVTGS